MSNRVEDLTDEQAECQCATRAEILERLRVMTAVERKTIVSRIRAVAMDDADDLLHEAILRALENSRKWYPHKIDFPTFLRGCARSIGHGWRKGSRGAEPADRLASPVNHQAQLEASITLTKVRDGLRGHPGHPHILEIFELKMNEGHTGPEIQQRLGITPQKYAAERKWISRTLRSEGYQK